MNLIRKTYFLFVLIVVTILITGCSGAAAVSSSTGPTISQARAQAYDGPKKRIAVKAFAFKASGGSSGVGQGMSDMLADALFNSGRFIVLERENIKDVIEEQDFGASGRVKRETAARIGEIEGAELIVRGSVIQFEPDCRGGSIILFSAKTACVAVNLRIVDATSGRVVNATTVEGTSSNTSVGIIFAGDTLPVGLGAWSKTPMEKAIRNTIEAAVKYIADAKI